MIPVDRYAYMNRLGTVHPGEKVAFAAAMLIICLAARSPLVPLTVFLFMMALLRVGAGIPWRVLCRAALLPFSFLLMGALAVLISITAEPAAFLLKVSVGGWKVGISAQGIEAAAYLFARSMGAVGCLYFLALTTPMIEIISILRKCRFPAMALELMTLVYRFTFVLLWTANGIYVAQASRLGYTSPRNAYRSLAWLISNLFAKAYRHAELLFMALTARGYNGELKVMDPPRRVSARNLLLEGLVIATFLILAIRSGGV